MQFDAFKKRPTCQDGVGSAKASDGSYGRVSLEKITDLEGVKRLAVKLRNWGHWGLNDQLGTVNYITAEKIRQSAKLVRDGKVFALGISLGADGPQRPYPVTRRFNPVHMMMKTGTDAACDTPDRRQFVRSADDSILMPTQCATHWDALSHVFYEKKMWNGYDCSLVTATGATMNGIENYKGKLVTRGVLLDVARYKQTEWLEAGYGITPEDLDGCLAYQGSSVETGDLLLIRTGQMGQVKKRGYWGDYAGGDAPGLTIETSEWLWQKKVAGVASDTWGVEMLPNATPDCFEPWHCIVIPNMGLLVGEMFDLEFLAQDCANDRRYEFMLTAPVLPIVGGIGSPVDPHAIK